MSTRIISILVKFDLYTYYTFFILEPIFCWRWISLNADFNKAISRFCSAYKEILRKHYKRAEIKVEIDV